MGFIHYMFLPVGAPWYTGAFWSNQTQWMAVSLPSFVIIIWRNEVHHRRHMKKLEELKEKI